jgi:hypothetical protein
MGKVPFDYLGQARQLYRDVEQGLFQAQDTLIKVHNRWMRRAQRKGTIRPEQFIETVRELKGAYHPFAFGHLAEYRKGYPILGFYHLTPAKLHHNGSDSCTELQFSIRSTILEVRKNLDEGDKFLASWDPVKLSLHAVARWFERSETKTYDGLLADLNHLADEAAGLSDTMVEFCKAHDGSDTFVEEFLKFLEPTIEVKCESGGKFIGKRRLERTKSHGDLDSFRWAKTSGEGCQTEAVLSIQTYYSKVMAGEDD